MFFFSKVAFLIGGDFLTRADDIPNCVDTYSFPTVRTALGALYAKRSQLQHRSTTLMTSSLQMCIYRGHVALKHSGKIWEKPISRALSKMASVYLPPAGTDTMLVNPSITL